MMRNNRILLIYLCLISVVACRHLEDTVSDAITKHKPKTAMLKADPTSTAGSDVDPDSVAQISPTVLPTDAATLSSSQNTTLSTDRISDETVVTAEKVTDKTKQGTDETSLLQTEPNSKIQNEQELGAMQQVSGLEPAVLGTDTSVNSEHAVVDNNNEHSADFKKEHAHIEVAATLFPPNNSRLSSNDKENNPDQELPYDKLDNVNVVVVDNSLPVVKPVLNHLDNDNINNIETIAPAGEMNDSPETNIQDDSSLDVVIEKGNSQIMTELLSEDAPNDFIPTVVPMDTTTGTVTTIAETNSQMDGNNDPTTTTTTQAVPAEQNIDHEHETDVIHDSEVNEIIDAIMAGESDREVRATPETKTMTEKQREPDDVDPLDIFVDDIKYQRFPDAMPLKVFREKISGKTFKKLYILESAEKRLFKNVRQLEATYDLDGNDLYAEFLFRFIYSRQCTRIERFKLGTLSNNSEYASFEKEVEGDKTERLVFFSEKPDDYVFFMSCTDFKTSPYACRDSYYVTLDSSHDPPNQFPWLSAAHELENQMNLSFEDPRFIFNFVMMPCART